MSAKPGYFLLSPLLGVFIPPSSERTRPGYLHFTLPPIEGVYIP